MTIKIDKEELSYFYNDLQYSQRDIAKYFGVGQTTIRRKMKEFNIPSHNSLESKHTEKSIKYLYKTIIQDIVYSCWKQQAV